MGRYLQLILLILMAMVAGEAASADPVQAPLRVGHLYPRMEPWSAAFYEGLEEQGFVDGRNVVVITREAHADFSRAPLLADQLIAVSPTVLVAQTGTLAREAQRAVQRSGKDIPIVFYASDPVQEGFVSNLAHPDRNMTGLTSVVSADIFGKLFELLLEAVPSLSHVAYFLDATAPPAYGDPARRELDKFARAKRVRLTVIRVSSAEEVEKSIERLKRERVGLIIPPTAFFVTHRRSVIDSVAHARLPAVYGDELFVRDGGLMGYWTSTAEIQRGLGRIVGELLKGKRPADIPVQQPSRFKLTINTTTADSSGLKLSQSLLLRADEIFK